MSNIQTPESKPQIQTPDLFCREVVDDINSTQSNPQMQTPDLYCHEVVDEMISTKPKKEKKPFNKTQTPAANKYLEEVASYDQILCYETLTGILRSLAENVGKSKRSVQNLKDTIQTTTDENETIIGDMTFDFDSVISASVFNTYDNQDYLKSIGPGGENFEARLKAVNYLFGACQNHGTSYFTLAYAVSYIDKLLSSDADFNPEWPKACLIVASKIVEPWENSDKELSSKLGISVSDMWEMALQVLTFFDGQAYYPLTPYTFLNHYSQLVNISVNVVLVKSERVILSSLRDTRFMSFKPWEIALSIILAICSSDDEDKLKSIDEKVLFNGTDKDKVMECVTLIELIQN